MLLLCQIFRICSLKSLKTMSNFKISIDTTNKTMCDLTRLMNNYTTHIRYKCKDKRDTRANVSQSNFVSKMRLSLDENFNIAYIQAISLRHTSSRVICRNWMDFTCFNKLKGRFYLLFIELVGETIQNQALGK